MLQDTKDAVRRSRPRRNARPELLAGRIPRLRLFLLPFASFFFFFFFLPSSSSLDPPPGFPDGGSAALPADGAGRAALAVVIRVSPAWAEDSPDSADSGVPGSSDVSPPLSGAGVGAAEWATSGPGSGVPAGAGATGGGTAGLVGVGDWPPSEQANTSASRNPAVRGLRGRAGFVKIVSIRPDAASR